MANFECPSRIFLVFLLEFKQRLVNSMQSVTMSLSFKLQTEEELIYILWKITCYKCGEHIYTTQKYSLPIIIVPIFIVITQDLVFLTHFPCLRCTEELHIFAKPWLLRMSTEHILQNAQVTSNKMAHRKRHHFMAQFPIPFHMVCSIQLQVLASKTIEQKLLIGQ